MVNLGTWYIGLDSWGDNDASIDEIRAWAEELASMAADEFPGVEFEVLRANEFRGHTIDDDNLVSTIGGWVGDNYVEAIARCDTRKARRSA